MRCLACCTAHQYVLKSVRAASQKKGYVAQEFHNVLHMHNPGEKQDIFFFPHGCFVSWGLSWAQEQSILENILPFSVNPLEKKESHLFTYQVGEKTTLVSHPQFGTDIITIEQGDVNNILLKLAISYALSQSVKLHTHEISIQQTVSENQPISHELAKKGRISLSRKAIAKRIGAIFLAKCSVNLSNDYLEVSEYFWRYPHLETYYTMAEKFLDMPKRLSTLNQRLDVIHDLILLLNNQLEYRYSSTLEIIIIGLIFGEILINLLYQFRTG